jgi:hypothetical protein
LAEREPEQHAKRELVIVPKLEGQSTFVVLPKRRGRRTDLRLAYALPATPRRLRNRAHE